MKKKLPGLVCGWWFVVGGLIFFFLPPTTYHLPFPKPVYAQSSIFEPETPRGIFGGVTERARGIFEGVQEGLRGIFEGPSKQEGGAIIPVIPILPTPGPSPPPRPDAGDFIKLSLKWEALSVGPESVAIAEPDPLEQEHLAKIGCCGPGELPPGEQCGPVGIRHVLWGWCGQKATYIGSLLPPCKEGEIPTRDNRCVPITTSGPNTYTFSGSISNKYIRRDGYEFYCVITACVDPEDCPPEPNYQEFQTLVFHTNDLAMYLKVENLSDHQVENILIKGHALMYTPLDETYSLPHNLEYPLELRNSSWPPYIIYAHGHQLPQISKIVEGENFANIPPIEIGPFDLEKGQTKTFPLQEQKFMRDKIPASVEDPYTCESEPPPVITTPGAPPITPVPPPPAKPCECRGVRLHEYSYKPKWSGPGCDSPLCDDPSYCPSGCPTYDQCQIYYGVLKVGDPKSYSDHAGGYRCLTECIQVDGCPPPSCFAPDKCSGPQPGSAECNQSYCSQTTSQESSTIKNSLSKVKKLLTKSFLSVRQAFGFGCPSSCVDPPRPGVKAQGAIVPRDFENFINETDCKKREFRDVTGSGGCGYMASSNNSIIGPIQFTAEYGVDRTSRSVLLASLPVGGRITDDEGRPFGWPVSGEIKQNWGNTGQAQAEGSYRSTPGQLYTDYMFCPGEGKTYPDDGRPRAGDYLHPGIDIKPPAGEVQHLAVYTTHAGWVTFAGDASALGRPEKGFMVQVESDVDKDNMPDFITRYEHLAAGSLQFDVQNKQRNFTPSATIWPLGSGIYLARNQLIGYLGDTGSPGVTQLHYEISQDSQTSARIDFSSCKDDPYILACLSDEVASFFFGKRRFEPELVKGPVYSNP